jgi:Tat protein translocase TatB subunit
MFGSLGGAELLFILILALLLFGPRKLPQLGRSLGRAMAEFRGASHEFRSNLEREVDLERLKETRSELSAASRELAQGLRGTGTEPPARHVGPLPRPADDQADDES